MQSLVTARWPAYRADVWGLGVNPDVVKDLPDLHALGDKGDQEHLPSALRAHQRENFDVVPSPTESLRAESTQTELDFRKFFAERLHAALDRHDHIPKGHGRGQAVAAMFGITRLSAAKWLNGDGLPDLWRLPLISRLLNVDVSELVGGSTSPMVIDGRYASLGG